MGDKIFNQEYRIVQFDNEILREYDRKGFFNETWDDESEQYIGGYYPDRVEYLTDKKGNLVKDENDNPIPDPNFSQRMLKKWVPRIKEGIKNIIPFVVVPRFGSEKKENDWYEQSPHIYIENSTSQLDDISSSMFKSVFVKGFDSSTMIKYVDNEVLDYIQQNNLYTYSK